MTTDVRSDARQRINAVGRVTAKPDLEQGAQSNSSIDELYQQGSARIRFPKTPPGPLHAVLLNTAGGLTGDDTISWEAAALAQSHLCISTAACEKIYRTHGPAAIQHTHLQVHNGARLEWLPQESILFNGSNLKRTLHAQLDEMAEALIVESLVFGRQAMNEAVDMIQVRDRWRIYRADQLLHAEDLRLDITPQLDAQRQCLMHQYGAMSTLVLISKRSQEWLDSLVPQVHGLAKIQTTHLRFGASALPSRLVVRILARDSFQLRKFLIPCLQLLNDKRPVPTVWKV